VDERDFVRKTVVGNNLSACHSMSVVDMTRPGIRQRSSASLNTNASLCLRMHRAHHAGHDLQNCMRYDNEGRCRKTWLYE
jgi:hypothetical protein